MKMLDIQAMLDEAHSIKENMAIMVKERDEYVNKVNSIQTEND